MQLSISRLYPWLLLLLALAACSSPDRNYKSRWYIFGTIVSLTIYEAEPEVAEIAADAVFRRFQEIDKDWYPWPTERAPAGGELLRINQAIANQQSIVVSRPTARLLRRAAELEVLSDGLFNPAIGHLSELWGFAHPGQDWPGPPPDAAITKALSTAPSTSQLSWQDDRLSSTSSDLVIDLGGIAKGAILEQAMSLLRDNGVNNAVIDIGGDVAVLGQHHDKAIRIGIKAPVADPEAANVLAWSELQSGETAFTSGDYERYFESNGERFQHILDPRDGKPVQHTVSVTVIDRDPLLADAAATALLVGGAGQFEKLSRSLGLRDAMLIGANGERLLTPSMQQRLNWTQRQDNEL